MLHSGPSTSNLPQTQDQDSTGVHVDVSGWARRATQVRAHTRVCRVWPVPVREQESAHGPRRVPTLVPSLLVPSGAQSPALTSMTLRTPQPSCGQPAAAACLRPCVQCHKPRSMRTRPGPSARLPLTAQSAAGSGQLTPAPTWVWGGELHPLSSCFWPTVPSCNMGAAPPCHQ